MGVLQQSRLMHVPIYLLNDVFTTPRARFTYPWRSGTVTLSTLLLLFFLVNGERLNSRLEYCRR